MLIEKLDKLPDVESDASIEVDLEGPEEGEDTGISNLIHDLIIDENEAIQGYNNAAANLSNYPEFQKIMQDIAGEEFAHIGELQKILEQISPNAAKIKEGELENNLEESYTNQLMRDAKYIKNKAKNLIKR